MAAAAPGAAPLGAASPRPIPALPFATGSTSSTASAGGVSASSSPSSRSSPNISSSSSSSGSSAGSSSSFAFLAPGVSGGRARGRAVCVPAGGSRSARGGRARLTMHAREEEILYGVERGEGFHQDDVRCVVLQSRALAGRAATVKLERPREAPRARHPPRRSIRRATRRSRSSFRAQTHGHRFGHPSASSNR